MKRLVAGLITLAFIIALGVMGMFYTDSFVNNNLDVLDSVNEKVLEEDFKSAKELCHRAIEDFEKKEVVFSLFLNHGLIESLEAELSQLPDLADKESENLFLSKLSKTKRLLLELKKSQKHIF